MSSMLERVARSICAARHDDLNGWDTLDSVEREQFMREARAVLEVMGEPTEQMISAAGGWDSNAPDDWRIMIEAALKERP